MYMDSAKDRPRTRSRLLVDSMNCSVKVSCILLFVFVSHSTVSSSGTCVGKTIDGRTPCRETILYLHKEDQYKKQYENCKIYNATLARVMTRKIARLAAKIPDFIEKNLYIGARQAGDNQYRWEGGPIVGGFDDALWGWDNLVHDGSGAGFHCLGLNRTAKWVELNCDIPSPAICSKCVIPKPPLDSCYAHCVCPGGKTYCKTKAGPCTKGCVFARSGSICSTAPCPPNRFGPNCEKQCFCANNTACDVETGACPGKCNYGWIGTACNQTSCSMHFFGGACNRLCYCRYGQQCDMNNGDCFTGCLPGAYGPSCVESKCPHGLFDNRCKKHCHCKNDVMCSQDDGYCFTSECSDTTWKGKSCNETICYTGSFGIDCKQFCACAHSEQCDLDSGKCPGKCAPGWKGVSCNETGCPMGKYGPLCTDCDAIAKWGEGCSRACYDPNCVECDKWDGQRCHTCKEGYERMPTHTCSKLCLDVGTWGTTCSKTCQEPTCDRCRKYDGSICVKCKDGYVVTPKFNCSKMCKYPSVWGGSCNKHCTDSKCFRCFKYDGARCLTCRVGYALGEDGIKCVADMEIDPNAVDRTMEGSNSITMPLTVALLLEVGVCYTLYRICGCSRRGVEEDTRLSNVFDQQWVEAAQQRRSFFVERAYEMEKEEEEERKKQGKHDLLKTVHSAAVSKKAVDKITNNYMASHESRG